MWVLMVLAVIGLTSCRNRAEDILPTLAIPAQPTPTLAPELTELPASPQPTATQQPPTATADPSPTPCQQPVQPDLAEAWSRFILGCPIIPGVAAVNTAYAPFEGGQMLWRGDTDVIYVLYNDGRWESYPNEWREGDPEFTCGEQNPLSTPIRGFGRVWCDHPVVREALGAATAAEIGDSESVVQEFVNGTILVAPFGAIFVLEGEAGTWQMVEVPRS